MEIFLYGNSNISLCKKYNLQKNPLKETKIFQDIITLLLISSFNTSQNIIFQKSSQKNRPIIIQGPKSFKVTVLYNESKHNILAIASMRSLVSFAQKEERNNDKQRRINIDKKKKNYSWELLRNNKDGFQFHFSINRPCWQSKCSSIGGNNCKSIF